MQQTVEAQLEKSRREGSLGQLILGKRIGPKPRTLQEPQHLRKANEVASVLGILPVPRPQRGKSLSRPRRPPSIPIGGADHGTWKLSLSGQGCPSGSVGSPFGSGSLPLPLPGAPRGRSSWRCRILTATFPWVCKFDAAGAPGWDAGSQNGTPWGSGSAGTCTGKRAKRLV